MGNLSDYYKKLTHRDKLEIICAWELMYGDRHSVGVVPFLDKDKVERSLIKRMAEGPNFGRESSVLRKLGVRVTEIRTENETEEIETNNGWRQSIVIGQKTRITIEREGEDYELMREEIVIEK